MGSSLPSSACSSWFGRAASELQQGRFAFVLVGADIGFLFNGLRPARLQARPGSMAQCALEHSMVHHACECVHPKQAGLCSPATFLQALQHAWQLAVSLLICNIDHPRCSGHWRIVGPILREFFQAMATGRHCTAGRRQMHAQMNRCACHWSSETIECSRVPQLCHTERLEERQRTGCWQW